MGNTQTRGLRHLSLEDRANPNDFVHLFQDEDEEQFYESFGRVQSKPEEHRRRCAVSIKISDLPELIKDIKKDFPQWNYYSETLKELFCEHKVDPKDRYARWYSQKPADIAITYTWSGSSLRDLLGKAMLL